MGNNQALKFYSVDMSLVNKSGNEIAGDSERFKKWFFENAKEIDLSEEGYKKIIIENPKFNNLLTSNIVQYMEPEFYDSSSNFIYLYIDKYSCKYKYEVLMSLPLAEKYKIDQSKLLMMYKKIMDKKVLALMVYDKEKGWFDYDETVRRNKKFGETK